MDYKTLYPIFVFDTSKQSEKLKSSVIDVQIRVNFEEAFPVGTQAYAVVISDKLLPATYVGANWVKINVGNTVILPESSEEPLIMFAT